MKIITAEFEKTAVDLKSCPAGERPEIALAGRSNVGKSSLLNKLVNRKGLARTSNTPGRTQAINFFLINGGFYLVDLPGYGYARVPVQVKAKWGPMVEKYLKERSQLKGVLQLVDVRHRPTEQDIQFYRWLLHFGLPAAVAVTKCDKLSRNQINKQIKIIKDALELKQEHPLVLFSALSGQGRDEIINIIEEMIGLDGTGQ
ncbi:GTP-binding protein EngB [Desulfocucumis palustris]|uniref:Probable GTP-binding protein EngB n=1 Tax=Desulfocucumis palustris TaxID=1898651 RepID=A0A2L2XFW5_9FIRM|nr:ribosome biogenesis GTP-binding protein YihA/YsxC [Desulfocucumis palustris]GBF34904.1 GTP-binding protein EngB [Desulfocucumis palustris]